MRSRLILQSLRMLLCGSVLVSSAVAHAAAMQRCAPAQALPACVAAVRAADPAAALQMGMPAWDAAADKQGSIALGLELVDAAAAAGQPNRVVSIGSALLAQPLSPQQRVRLFTQLNAEIWRPRDALRIAQLEGEMRRLETELPHDPHIAELWRLLARSYYKMGAQDDALRVARIALSGVRRHPDPVEYKANQTVFLVSAQQGRMPDAIAALLEAERVVKALGMPDDVSMLHNATGVFIYAHEWKKAIAYGQRALAAYDAMPYKDLTRADILNNLGTAYQGANELQRAEAIYRQALAAGRADGKTSLIGLLNNLGNVLALQHRPREALPLLREAVAMLEGAAPGGDHGEGGIVYSTLGNVLADLGQRDAAAAAFERARQMFTQWDNVPRRLELYPRMIDNLDALGRDREALALMREYKEVNDKAVNVESKTRIAELESAVDLARKNSELAALARTRAAEQAAYAQLQARAQRQRSVLYGLLAALLALAGFFLLKVREGRARRRINAELARKNEEIQAQHRELEQLAATIRRQSEEDALTGLRNRRYVTAWLQAREAAATPRAHAGTGSDRPAGHRPLQTRQRPARPRRRRPGPDTPGRPAARLRAQRRRHRPLGWGRVPVDLPRRHPGRRYAPVPPPARAPAGRPAGTPDRPHRPHRVDGRQPVPRTSRRGLATEPAHRRCRPVPRQACWPRPLGGVDAGRCSG